MKSWQTYYKPYEGDEPYIYLAFAEEDSVRIRRVVRIMLARGCRLWYRVGQVGTPEELIRRQGKTKEAALTVLYLTDALCEDTDSKTSILVNQKYERPIICFTPDKKDLRLKMNLREDTPLIPLYDNISDEDLDITFVHTKGFTQDLIGVPVKIPDEEDKFKKLIKWLSIVAMLVLIITFLGVRYLNWFQPEMPSESPEIIQEVIEKTDEIEINESVIRDAVRSQAEDGVITEELVNSITTLHLMTLPNSWEELEKLPNLERIEIPQQEIIIAEKLPDKKYTVILIGGDGP